MTKIFFFVLGIFLLSISSFDAHGKSTINRYDRNGKRTGYWVLGNDEAPTHSESTEKWKEGTFINGRKNGVWISYYEDGNTPRLIGEYADNRPSGAYFRFNRKGELLQASSIPRKITPRQEMVARNNVFSCKMRFDNQEVVAGQVYFSKKIFKKNASVQFWVEQSMQAIASESRVIDFTWLNSNYDNLYATYLQIRTPKLKERLELVDIPKLNGDIPVSKVAAKKSNFFFPPVISSPRLSPGMSFQPNGLNKLYTVNDEIWIDGYFLNGQLSDGKVFIYDRDGVLLKVRVYKKGIYHSDGVL